MPPRPTSTRLARVPTGAWKKRRATRAIIRYASAMSDLRPIRNLALIGFMGTGKSWVGHLVATAVQCKFVNTELRSVHEVSQQVLHQFQLARGSQSPVPP